MSKANNKVSDGYVPMYDDNGHQVGFRMKNLKIEIQDEPTQQKDARIEQILRDIKSAYDNEDPTAWGWGLQEIEKLVTQARQQAFTEALEEISAQQQVDSKKTRPMFNKAGVVWDEIKKYGYNQAIAEIRANIEQRMKIVKE